MSQMIPQSNTPGLQKTPQTKVFFDSHCPICSREVSLYKRIDADKNIRWVDLQTDASTAADMGIDYDEAMSLLHVIDSEGNKHVGIKGHILMWMQLPYLRHLGLLLHKVPPLEYLFGKAYLLFTRIRPGMKRQSKPDTPTADKNVNGGDCND